MTCPTVSDVQGTNGEHEDAAFCPRVSPLDQRYVRRIPREFSERTGVVRIYSADGVFLREFDPFKADRTKVLRGGTQAAIPPKREPLPHPEKQTKTGWR